MNHRSKSIDRINQRVWIESKSSERLGVHISTPQTVVLHPQSLHFADVPVWLDKCTYKVVRLQQQSFPGTRGAQGDRPTAMNCLFQKQEDLEHEQATFADCVAQHLPYLKRMVGGLTRHDPTTDDIVQQTMLKALVHADQFQFRSTLKTWLTSIAKNEVRQFYRCKWRMRSVPLTTEDLEGDKRLQADSGSSSCEAHEREAFIRQAASQLPKAYRSAVELCDLQGLPMNEAAARLRLTVAAVKTRRQRARKKLQRLLRTSAFK
jgi:RNA polymerase sigma-70 factor (ECF subfamily)